MAFVWKGPAHTKVEDLPKEFYARKETTTHKDALQESKETNQTPPLDTVIYSDKEATKEINRYYFYSNLTKRTKSLKIEGFRVRLVWLPDKKETQ